MSAFYRLPVKPAWSRLPVAISHIICVCMYIYMYVCKHAHTTAHARTHTQTHTHAHTHTHIQHRFRTLAAPWSGSCSRHSPLRRRTATPRWDVDGDDEENNNPNIIPGAQRDGSSVKVAAPARGKFRVRVLHASTYCVCVHTTMVHAISVTIGASACMRVPARLSRRGGEGGHSGCARVTA